LPRRGARLAIPMREPLLLKFELRNFSLRNLFFTRTRCAAGQNELAERTAASDLPCPYADLRFIRWTLIFCGYDFRRPVPPYADNRALTWIQTWELELTANKNRARIPNKRSRGIHLLTPTGRATHETGRSGEGGHVQGMLRGVLPRSFQKLEKSEAPRAMALDA
jgi:hypothetical protein